MFNRLTAMNLFTHLATSAANFVLLIGQRFAPEPIVLTCDAGEINENQFDFVALALNCRAEHPTN